MRDETEAARRDLVELMPLELQARIDAGEEVYTTTEMTALFTVEGFAAPFVIVTRKVDGVRGTLMFNHDPRYYFGWVQA